jgi:hypothetical protein
MQRYSEALADFDLILSLEDGSLTEDIAKPVLPELIATALMGKAAILEELGRSEDESRYTIEFIPLSFWYHAPLISRYSDRRPDTWLVYGLPSCSPAR